MKRNDILVVGAVLMLMVVVVVVGIRSLTVSPPNAIQEFYVQNQYGVPVEGASVCVGVYCGVTYPAGNVLIPVYAGVWQTVKVYKVGYECYNPLCGRCVNRVICEKDFYWYPNNIVTLGLESTGVTPTPTPSPTPPQICTPYEIECFGNRELWQCKSDGSNFQFMMSCPYGCVAGGTQCNPVPTQTPTPTPTATPTYTPTPTPTPDPGTCIANYEKRCFGDYLKTCNSAGDGWDETKTEFCRWGCDAEKKECPGFETVFAILGLLTVAYFVQRKRKEE